MRYPKGFNELNCERKLLVLQHAERSLPEQFDWFYRTAYQALTTHPVRGRDAIDVAEEAELYAWFAIVKRSMALYAPAATTQPLSEDVFREMLNGPLHKNGRLARALRHVVEATGGVGGDALRAYCLALKDLEDKRARAGS